MTAVRLLIVPLALGLGAWQTFSLALFGPLAPMPSVPAALTAAWPFEVARASGLDRLPAMRVELAQAALLHGDPERAAGLLAGVPETGEAADVAGRIALAQGRLADAIDAFAAAGDIVLARDPIVAAGERDPAAGEALAARFARIAIAAGAPLDVRAEAEWRAGDLAAAVVRERPGDSAAEASALSDYAAAVRDDPNQETYWLSEGLALFVAGDVSGARDAYVHGVALVPDGVDALLGLALADARLGDCTGARAAAARAASGERRQARVVDLGRAGYDAPSRAALQRCLDGPA